MIRQVKVEEISEKARAGECQIIDVREFPEFAAERIHNAKLVPLSDFEKHEKEIDRAKPVYIMCRSGNRAKQAADRLMRKGFTDINVIEGGMQAWSSANLPVIKSETKIWSLERQVRFTAGSLVVTGVLLGFFVWQPFLLLAGFIGAGLVFSAVTDTCGMALMLAKMPWNRMPAAACEPESVRS
jgi:rhodanese-related sulfurtransferase